MAANFIRLKLRVVFCLISFFLLSFINDARAQFTDQELSQVSPQIKLTDGVRASSSDRDSNWVFFDKDASMLPKTVYESHELSFWGNQSRICSRAVV